MTRSQTDEHAINYVSYLQLEQVLSAQIPLSRTDSDEGERFEHDEMLFIIIHQVYELWFKQILHEIDFLTQSLQEDQLNRAAHTLRRILTILKTLVGQIDILETMTPVQFNSFRSFLASSSGFQSVQFRELEFVLGYKRDTMLTHFPEGLYGRDALAERFNQPSLWDHFLSFLHRRGYAIPDEVLNRDVTQPVQTSEGVQAALLEIFRSDAAEVGLCERLVDLDEGLQEWRYRHVKMVARTIGSKQGTGGSPGVKYLETTIRPMWPDLWEIRAQL